MGLIATLDGSARGNGFLVAPSGGRTFPVPLGLKTDNGTKFTATLVASPGGAGIEINPSVVEVGPDEVTVTVRALTPSLQENDTAIDILRDGGLQGSDQHYVIEGAPLI